MEDKFNEKELNENEIHIPEGFGRKDRVCMKCFRSENPKSKLFLVPGEYERELDYVQNIIGSFIPIWAFIVLVNLGWRYGTLSVLTNYVMIAVMILSAIGIIGDASNHTRQMIGIALVVLMITLHGVITWYWVKKHNARVKANRIPSNSPVS